MSRLEEKRNKLTGTTDTRISRFQKQSEELTLWKYFPGIFQYLMLQQVFYIVCLYCRVLVIYLTSEIYVVFPSPAKAIPKLKQGLD